MIKTRQILLASVLGLASTTASAVTVTWQPFINTVDGTYEQITFLNFGITGQDLVLFDAGSIASAEPSPTSLTIADINGNVLITPTATPANGGSNYSAIFGSDTASLGATVEFELALYNSTSSTFTFMSGFSKQLDNAYLVSFDGINGTVQGVDLQPVPVPAAVWLFGSGLIGLAGVARRKA